MRNLLLGGGAAAVIIAGAGYLFLVPVEDAAGIDYETADIARGETIYAENCASCHGDRLQGQADWRSRNPDGTLPAPPHDDSGHTWHHPDSYLFDYTKHGGQPWLDANGVSQFTSAMPGFGEILSDQEIVDVLAFIRSRWSDRSRSVQADRTRDDQASN
jgi:mono/diheme cytochrome c family protein